MLTSFMVVYTVFGLACLLVLCLELTRDISFWTRVAAFFAVLLLGAPALMLFYYYNNYVLTKRLNGAFSASARKYSSAVR